MDDGPWRYPQVPGETWPFKQLQPAGSSRDHGVEPPWLRATLWRRSGLGASEERREAETRGLHQELRGELLGAAWVERHSQRVTGCAWLRQEAFRQQESEVQLLGQ